MLFYFLLFVLGSRIWLTKCSSNLEEIMVAATKSLASLLRQGTSEADDSQLLYQNGPSSVPIERLNSIGKTLWCLTGLVSGRMQFIISSDFTT
jgi:hypothetical protein